MAESDGDRQKGTMILNNYKRQIAERMAREKVDSEDLTKQLKRSSQDTLDTISRRIQEVQRNQL